MATKLRTYNILKPFFRLRDWLMAKTNLFEFKRFIKNKLLYRRLLREDAELKRQIEDKIFALPNRMLPSVIQDDDFVISLTSYGKRVGEALPYALYSLLTQTICPKKIIVYLDHDNWSDEKLPELLKHLQRVGVEFRYCEDIRSYKKLIPALIDFPENPIITVDDDFYYNSNYMEWMEDAYEKSDKRTVLGQWGCIPEKKDGKYVPYSEWKDCKYGEADSPISFFGCCCCYPPHIFDEDIIKEELFMSLCPTADDIWFWAQEERLGIARQYIEPHGYGYNRPVNRIEEYDWNQKGTLMYENVMQGKNDLQLRNVIDYYHLEEL